MGKDASGSEIVVIGNIPDRYVEPNSKNRRFQLGYVHIKNRVIQDVQRIRNSRELKSVKDKFKDIKVIQAHPKGAKGYSLGYDYIYPGMIDLHNHTKQNNLGVWDLAQGQFKNRFEWRGWTPYKYSVSGNMNPWIGYDNSISCATFRWSEMQAMVLGITYLQGPSSCIDGFSIHQVEDNDSYITNKERVQAPTDLVIPNDMTYVWDELRPLIKSGKSYEEALAIKINEACEIPNITAETVLDSALSVLRDKKYLVENCKKTKLHSKFLRYVYWVHPSIAGKKRYIESENRSAIIAHLAEGRRDDHYNQKEFEVVKLLGLDKPNVNFVHGVGISKDDFAHMAKRQMGLIWSLYSNLLLYGQTLDIYEAKKAGIIMSLGSDWLPTGTRGILEELKLAANYVDKDPNKQGLKKLFTDEELFLMVTENPAKLINHYDINIEKKEHGIGQLRVGAMGSLIVVSKKDKDPYTNLVRRAFAEDINLVLIDGKPLYGDTAYLNNLGIQKDSYEEFPMYIAEANSLQEENLMPTLPEKGSSRAMKKEHAYKIAKKISEMKLTTVDNCNWKRKKGFVHQDTIMKNKYLKPLYEQTGLNLDRFEDIQKLLAVNLMTQTRNLNEPSKGKLEYAITKFPPLISCHSEKYLSRLNNFVSPTSDNDEFSKNRDPATVDALRKMQNLGRIPESLAEKYAD
tara:strand:- start:122537 stop:124588 length:2052 start_codon:yes stop_codon:yes gene_type:complete